MKRTVLAALVVLMMIGGQAGARTIYGDREPVELFYPHVPAGTEGWGGAGFWGWSNNQDAAILVHVPGDRLDNLHSLALFGMSLSDLDRQTRERDILVFWNENAPNPALCVSASSTAVLQEELGRDGALTRELASIWFAEEDFSFFFADDSNTSFESSGHRAVVYQGLFRNPDYGNTRLLLSEDEQTRRTNLVEEFAGLVNDDQDRSTLREIYNVIQARVRGDRPDGFTIFESTAHGILSTGVATGCTDYALAFATLARAKGMPAVVVDSAQLEWIEHGARLNRVAGHFFVEVLLGNEWVLVDSTSGALYIFYDRDNWLLPEGYIAFTKALSVIDTGATEESHNTLQRVAFWGKEIEYREPDYARYDLRDERLIARFAPIVGGIPTESRPPALRITRSTTRARLEADPEQQIPGM
jgi:hypothetical protein